MSPNDAQNSACASLHKAGYKLNKTQSEQAAKALKTGPVFVFERWFAGHVFQRIIVGELWVTVTHRKGCEPTQYHSYETKLYRQFAKAVESGG